ncbi:hypothetical protein [Fictibacillus macauensis]|nr:hypothetical protein [Fictibacillus macauensis]
MNISIKNVQVEAITMKGSLNIGKNLILRKYEMKKKKDVIIEQQPTKD